MHTAVLFPGQGAHTPAMGVPWRGHAAWDVVDRAEAALGEPIGELLTDATPEMLARTRNAQLATFLASLVAWEAAAPTLESLPAFAAGHSLGQLTALVAAGALSLEEGTVLVARRAELTQEAADRRPGRMVALLGATVEQAESACASAPGECWVANDNGAGQVVVAGTPEGVEAATRAAPGLGVRRVTPLNVGGAFHTPLMAEAATAFAEALGVVTFGPQEMPVVCNTDGQPHDDASGWPPRLVDQLVRPVRWRQSVENMAALGCSTFLEVGPGRVLSGLVRRIVAGAKVANVAVPDELPKLAVAS